MGKKVFRKYLCHRLEPSIPIAHIFLFIDFSSTAANCLHSSSSFIDISTKGGADSSHNKDFFILLCVYIVCISSLT
jgi:hypothetical protein